MCVSFGINYIWVEKCFWSWGWEPVCCLQSWVLKRSDEVGKMLGSSNPRALMLRVPCQHEGHTPPTPVTQPEPPALCMRRSGLPEAGCCMGRQALSGGPPLLWLKTGGGTAAGCHPGTFVRAMWEFQQGCRAALTRLALSHVQPYAGRSWKHSSSPTI